jgi:hypothetical protein
MNGWLAWQVATDSQFGERAKNIFGGVAGAYKWIFDAVSLGIQTVGTLAGLFSPLGQAGDRPIGVTRDEHNPNNGVFSPKIIELTKHSAEALLTADLNGKGNGIFTVEYKDDGYLRGDYVLWFQIERIGPNNPDDVAPVGPRAADVAILADPHRKPPADAPILPRPSGPRPFPRTPRVRVGA